MITVTPEDLSVYCTLPHEGCTLFYNTVTKKQSGRMEDISPELPGYILLDANGALLSVRHYKDGNLFNVRGPVAYDIEDGVVVPESVTYKISYHTVGYEAMRAMGFVGEDFMYSPEYEFGVQMGGEKWAMEQYDEYRKYF